MLDGEVARPNTMVLVEKVTDGGWGIGDHVLTLAMIQSPTEGGGAPHDNAASS
jgi:4-oxalocrotonate tautomerase